MYKAIHRETGDEIVLLHPRWKDEIKKLRRWSRANILICQACRQPVRVRAGEIREWHLAHKHLKNCPYRHETPALVYARGVLYEWLRTKFGDTVTLEKMVPNSSLPRYIDCWVEHEGKAFAYWIVEGTKRPPVRDAIAREVKRLTAHTTWIFLAAMLRQDSEDEDCVHLSTTERAFLQQSEYDITLGHYARDSGRTLHYLNAECRELMTFRNLCLIHEPQMYRGEPLENDLLQILVSPKTGEFVHPGEHEKLRRYKAEQATLEEQQQRRGDLRGSALSQAERIVPASRHVTLPGRQVLRDHSSAQVGSLAMKKEEALCVFCGKWTNNWWSFDGATKTCKCRECYSKGKT